MTAQMPEILIHRGQRLAMTATPLCAYIRRRSKHKRPKLVWFSTACWRRYVGTWEIRDDFLTLVALETLLDADGRIVEADLQTTLPWVRSQLRATWFSGVVRCPEGRLLRYAHNAFQSTYERDRQFFVSNGRVMDEVVEVKPPLSLLYRIQADGGRQYIEDYGDNGGSPDPLEGRPLTDAYVFWGQKPQTERDADEGYLVAGECRRADTSISTSGAYR